MSYPIKTLFDPETPAHVLTFAAESHGQTRSIEALGALLWLQRHADPLVREGVVYGLSNYNDNDLVRVTLARIAEGDTSPGVREAAREALEP